MASIFSSTVILNEVGLHILLETPRGPVQREVERLGEVAADALQLRINEVIENPVVRPNADVRMVGNEAIVGVLPHGSVADYIGVKLERENWWLDVGEEAVRGA